MGAQAAPVLSRPPAPTRRLETARLVLEPLTVEHAETMAAVLADPALHTWTGGAPEPVDALRAGYARQVAGDPTGAEGWHNWVVTVDGRAVGYVQATVGGDVTSLAWVIGTPDQGRGYAIEAARAVAAALPGPKRADVHPGNLASQAVAGAIGLHPSAEVVDGETVWRG